MTVKTLKGKERSGATFRLYFRVCKGKKKKDIPTPIILKSQDWKEGKPLGQVLKSNPDHIALNRQIAELYALYSSESIINDITISSLERELFQGYSAGTNGYYKPALKIFRDFAGDIALSEITLKLLKEFEEQLRSRKNKKGNYLTADGIENYFKPLNALFKLAIGKGLFPLDKNPMVYFRVDRKRAKGKAGKKESLTKQEIDLIRKAELRAWQHEARLIYLFEYLMGGIRISDICILRKQNIKGAYLKYRMMKTERFEQKEEQVIVLNGEAWEILEYFNLSGKHSNDLLFPLLRPEDFKTEDSLNAAIKRETKRVNGSLDTICKALKIEKNVTNHTARHSIKDHLDDLEDNQRVIADIMGHEHISTTHGYAKRKKQARMDEALNKVRGK